MIRWFCAAFWFAAAAGLLTADEKKEAAGKGAAKVQVTRLEIRKSPPVKRAGPLVPSSGISLAIRVSPPGKSIMGIDIKGSKLDSLTDDKKNNLYKKAAFSFGGSDWLSEFAEYSPEGDAVTLHVNADGAPGSGASKILLKASLALKCGSNEKATEKKAIALKAKEQIDLGPFKVQIGPFGGNQVLVVSDKENVKSVEFYDEKGKKVETSPPNRLPPPPPAAPGGAKKMQYTYSYFVFEQKPKVFVKINYCEKLEKVTVPLDLRVGLSLE